MQEHMLKGSGKMAEVNRLRNAGLIFAVILLVCIVAGCGGTKPEPAKVAL